MFCSIFNEKYKERAYKKEREHEVRIRKKRSYVFIELFACPKYYRNS